MADDYQNYVNGMGHPFLFVGNKIPTNWSVFESYLIVGTMAVPSSDSHTFFLVWWSSINRASC